MTEKIDQTRYSWFRPPDPGWADREVVGRVRETLKKLDPKLDAWWDPEWKADDPEKPGRWAIVYWMQRAHRWSIVFWWEGAAGEFKPLSMECLEPLLQKLAECDTEKVGDVYSIDRAAKFMQEARAKKRKIELRQALMEHALDYGRRLAGKLITVGPGGHRSRKGLGPDESFEQFLRERGIR